MSHAPSTMHRVVSSDVPSMYPIIDASGWPVRSVETEGDDEKYWLDRPDTAERWLFKPVTIHPHVRQGEDWAEKVASELAALLKLPAAKVELATWQDQDGCLSLDARPDPEQWQHHPGNVLLRELIPEFDPKARGAVGHSLINIAHALEGCGPPPSFGGPVNMTAFEVFVGYLLFDAWIANTDRHSRNWSVMQSPRGGRVLMPTYDHASSFGFSIDDGSRARALASADALAAWCRRGRGRRFEGFAGQTLVQLAAEAAAMLPDAHRAWWRAQLQTVSVDMYKEVVSRTPRMSELASEFTVQILTLNQGRLLDVF
jgi:hypothetical protein